MKYRTTIEGAGKSAAGIEVPAEIVEALGGGKRARVVVRLNGYTYRNAIGVVDGRSMIGVSNEHRAASGLAVGEEVEVELELDTAPREVAVPPELQAALDAEPAAQATFDRLSPSNRGWHVAQVTGTSNEETRRRRIEKQIAALRDGLPR